MHKGLLPRQGRKLLLQCDTERASEPMSFLLYLAMALRKRKAGGIYVTAVRIVIPSLKTTAPGRADSR